MKIRQIEGVGPAYAEKLAAAGITTTEALLKAAGPLWLPIPAFKRPCCWIGSTGLI